MNNRSNKKSLCIVASLLACSITLPCVFSSCTNCSGNESDTDTTSVDSTTLIDSTILGEVGDTVIRVENSQPEFKEDGYSFTVKILNDKSNFPEGIKFEYQLVEPFGNPYDNNKKVIATSDNGEFSKVPYSEKENSYTLRVYAKAGNNIVAKGATDLTGFIKQEKVNRQMTVVELQKMIDKQDESLLGAGENAYLSPDVKLIVKGLDADDPAPDLMGDVFNNLKMRVWSKAKVISLKHDDMNRISEVVLQVSY